MEIKKKLTKKKTRHLRNKINSLPTLKVNIKKVNSLYNLIKSYLTLTF